MSFRKLAFLLIGLFWLGQASVLKADDDPYAPAPAPTPYNNEADTYYRAMEVYFQVTHDQIASTINQLSSEENAPVVFFIAQRGGVDPSAILSTHASGLNWMQTAWHFKVNPMVFFTPLNANAQKLAPYLRPYSLYHNRSTQVRLTDDDVVNLVNLKMISEEYACPPEEVAQRRADSKGFRDINDQYARRELASWDIPELDPNAPPEHKRHLGDKADPNPSTGGIGIH